MINTYGIGSMNFVDGIIVGVLCTLFVILVICWIIEYGINLPLYQKTGIFGIFCGMVLMHCLHKIDWSVGF